MGRSSLIVSMEQYFSYAYCLGTESSTPRLVFALVLVHVFNPKIEMSHCKVKEEKKKSNCLNV